jgi:hypothetical protein
MTYTPQHGRRHEIEFYEPPSGNEFLDGIAQVICGPDATWTGNHRIAFRCLHTSDDKRTYIIEEVDIYRDLLQTSVSLSKYTKIVEIHLECRICSTKYQVWRIVGDDWTQSKYWLYPDHCPACPPMSPDAWLAQLGYCPERPTIASPDSRSISSNHDIDMADFT